MVLLFVMVVIAAAEKVEEYIATSIDSSVNYCQHKPDNTVKIRYQYTISPDLILYSFCGVGEWTIKSFTFMNLQP